MPSRTARKRYRRKLAKATAQSPVETLGGFGEGSEVRRSDWRTVRRAIREGWDFSPVVGVQIMRRAFEAMDSGNERMQLAVIWMVIEAVADNQRREHEQLDALYATDTPRSQLREP